MAEELKSCRNCGGKCDPTGWMRGDGRQGPECEGCGITTPDVESWNRLMGEQSASQGGEAVEVVAHMYQHDETGLVGFVDQQQVDWGFEKNNPRLHLCGELMTVAQHQRILAASVGSAEPVAWAHPAYLKTGALGFEASVCRLSSLQVPLYTHPADQVADDLTMVKVSRELLEIVFRYADDPSRQLSPGVGAPGHCHREPGKWDGDGGDCELCAAYDQLRALLAKP